MNWFKINNKHIVCLETGQELILNRKQREHWAIHSTGFQGFIYTFKDANDEEAQITFNEFIAKLNPIEINEKEENKENKQEKQEKIVTNSQI